ncbi:MAG: alternative ribosome rescue aminoacyl-tRNA hydrolase ArfB [Methanosarcinaceae archaeon]
MIDENIINSDSHIFITETLVIPLREIHFDFIRSSGPGGQNVNKVATTAQLRFDVNQSPSLPEDVRERLRALAGKRISEAGILIITARRFRTQERNRQDAINRLIALIQKAAEPPPKPRPKKRPSPAAKRRRLEEKRRQSDKKSSRKFDPNSDLD